MEKKKLIPLILVFAFGNLLGCSENETSFPSMDSTGTTETEDTEVTEDMTSVAGNSVLYFRLGTIRETTEVAAGKNTISSLLAPTTVLDNSSVPVTQTQCQVLTDAAGNAVPAVINCTFDVPELTLFYSHLKFIVGTKVPGQCRFLGFEPYHYRRSASADYIDPSSGTKTGCSSSPAPAACYGGAAPSIMSLLGISFPAKRGVYFFSDKKQVGFYYLKSEGMTGWYNGQAANLLASNHGIRSTPPSTPFNDARDEMVYTEYYKPHYEFICRDASFEEKYRINVFIRAEKGLIDHLLTWDR